MIVENMQAALEPARAGAGEKRMIVESRISGEGAAGCRREAVGQRFTGSRAEPLVCARNGVLA